MIHKNGSLRQAEGDSINSLILIQCQILCILVKRFRSSELIFKNWNPIQNDSLIDNLDQSFQDKTIQTTIPDKAVMILVNWQRNNYAVGPKVIDFEGNLELFYELK